MIRCVKQSPLECSKRSARIISFKDISGDLLALKSTVFKASLQVNDLDRHYYQTHALTLAQHPSETEERVMVRLLVFALHADEALQFGRGISSEEPDLWRKDLTG